MLAGRTGDMTVWTGLHALVARAGIEMPAQDAKQARLAFLRSGKERHSAVLNLGDCATYVLAGLHALPLLFTGEHFTQTDLDYVALYHRHFDISVPDERYARPEQQLTAIEDMCGRLLDARTK